MIVYMTSTGRIPPIDLNEFSVDDVKYISRNGRKLVKSLRTNKLYTDDGDHIPLNPNLSVPVKVLLEKKRYVRHGMTGIYCIVFDLFISNVDQKKGRIVLLMDDDGELHIAAAQGHTKSTLEIKDCSWEPLMRLWDPKQDTHVVVHGTNKGVLESIKQHGLNSMNRAHIHMAPKVNGSKSGPGWRAQKDDSVVLYVDLMKYSSMEGSKPVWVSTNGVILCEGPIPFDCVKYVTNKDGMCI